MTEESSRIATRAIIFVLIIHHTKNHNNMILSVSLRSKLIGDLEAAGSNSRLSPRVTTQGCSADIWVETNHDRTTLKKIKYLSGLDPLLELSRFLKSALPGKMS